MAYLAALFFSFAVAKEPCAWNPQLLTGIEVEAPALEKILSTLKGTVEYPALKDVYNFSAQQKAYLIDVNNDGREEILLEHEDGPEHIRRFLVLSKKGEKVHFAAEIPFPFTYNQEPRFVSACGRNYVASEDGLWLIEHGKLVRACGGDRIQGLRQELKQREDTGDYAGAYNLGISTFTFCHGHLTSALSLQLQNELALDALKKGAPALCSDMLNALKANRDFAAANEEFKTTVDHELKLCAPPPIKIKTVEVISFPDLTKLFKVGDEDTEATELERQKTLRQVIIQLATPDMKLRFPSKTVNREKTFHQWLEANAKVDPDFDTKAGHLVMWRGASSKSGEEASLVWADAQNQTSAVAVSLGLSSCIVGSKSVNPKSLPADLQAKLHDVCSEATSAIFYDGQGKATDILAAIRAAPAK